MADLIFFVTCSIEICDELLHINNYSFPSVVTVLLRSSGPCHLGPWFPALIIGHAFAKSTPHEVRLLTAHPHTRLSYTLGMYVHYGVCTCIST